MLRGLGPLLPFSHSRRWWLAEGTPASVILGSMEQCFVHAECVYPIQRMILDHSLASLGAAAGEVHTGA